MLRANTGRINKSKHTFLGSLLELSSMLADFLLNLVSLAAGNTSAVFF